MTTVAAILQVDDGERAGADLTERLGEALYGSFLAAGPYAEVVCLQGSEGASERLAAAVIELASRHALVDVVLSIHTTEREPQAWAGLLSPARGRLRLVYTTACHGDEAERAAWVAAGARTVVSHLGFNNPIVAAPLFLSRWLDGGSVAEAVTEAYREEAASSGVGLSLPGAPTREQLAALDRDVIAGTVPAITGDATLTIGDGLDHHPECPDPLRHDRARGGSLGLLLAACAGRATLDGKELMGLIGGRGAALPFPLERLAALREARAAVDDDGRGRLELDLAEDVRLKVGHGVVVTLDEEVRLTPVTFDPTAPEALLRSEGICVQWAAFWARLTEVTLHRDDDDEGYAVTVATKLFDVVPWRQTFRVGGGAPLPPAAEGPTLRAVTRA